MSKRFLVFQHVNVEHPGIFREFMWADGIAWDTVELDSGHPVPELAAYDALIVMGGPMDVWEEAEHAWLVAEKAAIRHMVADLHKPYLGVCLGHQLLADALGGSVGKARQGEVGVMEVALTPAGVASPFFDGVPAAFPCLQWHGAEVLAPPAGAAVLAQSPACQVQAFAIGTHAFSFQFHVEVIATTVDDWHAIPAYRDSLSAALGADGAAGFREAAARHMPQFNALARRIYDNWSRTAFA